MVAVMVHHQIKNGRKAVMKILILIFIIIVVVVELSMITGSFLTIKYEIEMSTNISEILSLVYSIVNTLSLIIIFDLLCLFVMYVLYFKK